MKTLAALLLLTTSAAAYTAPPTPCVPATAELALKTFDQSFSEDLRSVALASNGVPGGYMLTVSPDDSWTLLYVPEPGTVCVVAAGRRWTNVYPLNGPPQR